MSPASLKKRKNNTQQECNKDKNALAKYRHMEVTLDDDQNDEMVDIMDKIDTVGKQTLEEKFMDAESSGLGGSVRKIWEDNKQNTKDVKKDQKRNSKFYCNYHYSITYHNYSYSNWKERKSMGLVTIRLGMYNKLVWHRVQTH